MRYDFPKLRYYWVSGNPLRAMNETNIKLAKVLYAKNGIFESWLVDLNEFQVEVYLNPTANGYLNKHVFDTGKILIPKRLSHIEIPVSNILSP